MDEFDAYADDLAYSKRASGISCTRQIDSSTCGRPIIAPKLTECIYGGSEEISHSWSWVGAVIVHPGWNSDKLENGQPHHVLKQIPVKVIGSCEKYRRQINTEQQICLGY
ncbi:unnamed protein product [Rotaria socialis]|uniref:Uncharacterized protein n=1 Tax=Rotaria socialis TaxID=392032 RepID=A0A821DTX6_9BILA|nr:unnamed protein product [Rotaria socialis]CAF4567713.1 unnamed protein product [Rotaria socialis]CAF4626281.1 unnamed protein product [Rotaria socialis]CAF4749809.1 unnamed protein product [Rotaria socialis]